MIAYPVHIASERDEPYPRAWQMELIGADTPLEALEKLKQRRIVGEPGQTHVWLRVVTGFNLDGTVGQALTQQVRVEPVARDN